MQQLSGSGILVIAQSCGDFYKAQEPHATFTAHLELVKASSYCSPPSRTLNAACSLTQMISSQIKGMIGPVECLCSIRRHRKSLLPRTNLDMEGILLPKGSRFAGWVVLDQVEEYRNFD